MERETHTEKQTERYTQRWTDSPDRQTGEILETQHTGKAEFCKDGWKEELRNRQIER